MRDIMNDLLARYKHLIDFNDKMQKSNYRFVEGYLSFQKRKNHEDWEQDCIDFLKGAIKVQEDLLLNIRKAKAKFG
ncbi:hypothetical protein [Bacillus smithii]|uniref:hypothetical protein n=1 Tax=Bacillus smithii TaxID=1479 RepID=UPI003D1D7928